HLTTSLKISLRLAKRIIAFRPYKTIDQLNQVWGVDSATLERIKTHCKIESEEPIQTIEISPSPVEPEPQLSTAHFTISNEVLEESVLATDIKEPQVKEKDKDNSNLNFLLFFIILIGAFFRFNGINWDLNKHQHPDERYITDVATNIQTVSSLKEYFDTANSTMNPVNHGSYTYGMLPLFTTRIVAEIIHKTSYDQIVLVGRVISGVFDMLALWMIYLLAKKLYGKKTGVLAAGLYAAAVFPIQMSHFFTVDSFCTVFVILAVYLALNALHITNPKFRLDWQKLVYFGLFGLVVGMAGACKINALPVFAVIILAAFIHFMGIRKQSGFGNQLLILLTGLILAALTMAVGFRIFQPYAFMGPGFFGLGFNQRWIDTIKEVTNQVAGFSEWPPNHHWTNRPLSYAWVNMVVWGMGIPLGIAGWAGWAWSAFRMWKGEWRIHVLPFAWVLVYFVWQNLQFWRYMRYFLIIYPFIIMFAAWALMQLWEKTRESRQAFSQFKFQIRHPLSGLQPIWKGLSVFAILSIVLLYTYGYAFGFAKIYTRTMTRIAASNWIIDNIQGPLNLKVDTENGQDNYPITMINRWTLEPGDTPEIDVHIAADGSVNSVTAQDIQQVGVNIYFRIAKQENGDEIVVEGRLPVADDDTSTSLDIRFGEITLIKDATYYFSYKVTNSSSYSLSDVSLQKDDDENTKIPLVWETVDLDAATPTEGKLKIVPLADVPLNHLKIDHFEQSFNITQTTLKISLLKDGDENNPLSSASQTITFDQPGLSLAPTFTLPKMDVSRGSVYQLRYEITAGGPIRLLAEPYALETTWDDALPLAVKYLDPLGGIYQPLNLQTYEPDTPEKRKKMIDILDKSHYLVIPSNRSYDSMPRLPNRYPMTTRYYQELFDCANCIGDDLENKAYGLNTGFISPLGFELVAVFVSNPSIGPFQLNDQSADESFTVYDHPKVLIFKKSADFSIEHVEEIFNSIDLDNVLFQSPMSYTKAPTAMQLSQIKLTAQKIGGTWSAMFDRLSAVNTSQVFGTIVWYLVLLILGLLVFPLVFTVFAGLPDRGYPLARMAALLLTA
ncbi:MAG: glycosyltransferase family 39 protein, partial [Anaerolineaceae bacterium]